MIDIWKIKENQVFQQFKDDEGDLEVLYMVNLLKSIGSNGSPYFSANLKSAKYDEIVGTCYISEGEIRKWFQEPYWKYYSNQKANGRKLTTDEWGEENKVDALIGEISTHLKMFGINSPEFKRLFTISLKNWNEGLK